MVSFARLVATGRDRDLGVRRPLRGDAKAAHQTQRHLHVGPAGEVGRAQPQRVPHEGCRQEQPADVLARLVGVHHHLAAAQALGLEHEGQILSPLAGHRRAQRPKAVEQRSQRAGAELLGAVEPEPATTGRGQGGKKARGSSRVPAKDLAGGALGSGPGAADRPGLLFHGHGVAECAEPPGERERVVALESLPQHRAARCTRRAEQGPVGQALGAWDPSGERGPYRAHAASSAAATSSSSRSCPKWPITWIPTGSAPSGTGAGSETTG